jgi:hypothetical protein
MSDTNQTPPSRQHQISEAKRLLEAEGFEVHSKETVFTLRTNHFVSNEEIGKRRIILLDFKNFIAEQMHREIGMTLLRSGTVPISEERSRTPDGINFSATVRIIAAPVETFFPFPLTAKR